MVNTDFEMRDRRLDGMRAEISVLEIVGEFFSLAMKKR
jgi:hypothetical protein